MYETKIHTSDNTEIKEVVPDTSYDYCDTIETIIDLNNFGRKGKTKLEMRLIFTDTNSLLNLKMFTLSGHTWKLMDEMNPSCFVPVLSPVFVDMNGDGYKDLLFHSCEAARGANVIQTLVLFDPKRNRLKEISGVYPNMEYNSKLNCINSWGWSGGSSTAFLKIRNDSLILFAYVDHFDHRITSHTVDADGNHTELFDIPEGKYRGQHCFKNYDPIEW